MRKRKSIKRHKRAKRKSLIKNGAAVKKEIEQLRTWTKNKTTLDFILSTAGCGITFVGQVIELSISDTFEGNFLFVVDTLLSALAIPPIRISLIPQLWQKSEVSDYISPEIHVEDEKGGHRLFTIRESAQRAKPPADLEKITEQFRLWSKTKTNLHVFQYQGAYALSFIGQAHEITAELFGIAFPSGIAAQLILFFRDYADVKMEIGERSTKILLTNAQGTEVCIVSDAPTPPEDLFKHFPSATSTVH